MAASSGRRPAGKAPRAVSEAAREPENPAPPAPEPVPAKPKKSIPPPVHRAGGHVDRGDGRGWVLDRGEE